MFRNILVSIDGSDHAARALEEAIDLASVSGARLTILTAVPQSTAWAGLPMAGAASTALADDLEREYERILHDAVERVPQSIPVTKLLSHDSIRHALAHELERGHHDLLVMGSRGRGAITASLLGSVSHFALNHSPIAVLIVHAETDADAGASQAEGDTSTPETAEIGPGEG